MGYEVPTIIKVRVQLDARTFIVEFESADKVLRIKERMTYELFSIEKVYLRSYWVASSHSLGKGDTLPKRVIEAARAKLNAAP